MKKISRSEFATIHDCFCTSIIEQDNAIIFNFDEGFYINVYDATDSHIGTFLSKDCSMQLNGVTRVHIIIQEDDVVDIPWSTLVSNVNSKEWEIEMLMEETTDTGANITCDLNVGKTSKDFKYEVFFITLEIDFQSNEKVYGEIDLDRPW